MSFKVSRADGIRLCQEAGFNHTAKWDDAKLAHVLRGLPAKYDGGDGSRGKDADFTKKSLQLLDELAEAVDKKQKVEILNENEDDTAEQKKPKDKAPKKKKKKAEPVEEEDEEEPEEEDEDETEESESEGDSSEDEDEDEEKPVKKTKEKKVKKKTKESQPAKKAKKKEKPEKPAKKKKAKAKESKTEKDKFGARLGTQAANINACISEKPTAIEKIAKKFPKLAKNRVRSHIRFLTDKGFVKVDKEDRVIQKKTI